MGIVTWGIPQQIVLELAKLNESTTFIETGTYEGGTARWAADHFEVVHTIERAESLYKLHSPALMRMNVTAHLGDSRQVLPQIVNSLGAKRAVHWLDGHWSGGVTAGEGDECPILGELACLSGRWDDIILIDDARLFLCAPPKPHDPAQWPTITSVIRAIPYPEAFVQIVDDVIFILPAKASLIRQLVGYSQNRAGEAANTVEIKPRRWLRFLRT